MNPNKCSISIVLDRSGSMESIATDIIGGFNRFIEEQRAVPGECLVSLVQFDEHLGVQVERVHDQQPIGQVPRLTAETYQPRGGTPLYDAVGRTIAGTGEALAKIPEAERPGKVVFVIITDGLENASKEYTQARVGAMIKEQTDTWKWQFVFLGADINSYAAGGGINVCRAQTMNMAKNSVGVSAAYVSTGENLRKFRTGECQDMGYSAADKLAQRAAGADE